MGHARSAHPALVEADEAATTAARSRLRPFVALLTIVLVTAAAAAGFARLHEFVTARDTPRVAPAPSALNSVVDRRLVAITLTTPAWTKLREVVTVDRLRTDRRLWRQMHVGDWDLVPAAIREPALDNMIHAYAAVFEGPRRWRRMAAADWDNVPQPIRAMAYLRMIWHWAAAERVGVEFGLRPRRVAQTIGAIVMAESWFEHRAINENEWGRDLGLAQCSTFCQRTMAAMALAGAIHFAPSEPDYFNPWVATRVATVWFERELHRAEGDVNLAIRAYHRGIDEAMDERGDAYLARVLRLREQYVREQKASASWRYLARTIAPL
jgi:hypothetical protein